MGIGMQLWEGRWTVSEDTGLGEIMGECTDQRRRGPGPTLKHLRTEALRRGAAAGCRREPSRTKGKQPLGGSGPGQE